MFAETVGGGVLILVLAVLCGAIMAGPGWWSRRHPDEARRAVAIRTAMTDQRARRHPAYFVVFLPLLTAAVADLRWNAHHHSHPVLTWTLPAAIGLAFGLVLGAVVLHQARRRGHSLHALSVATMD